MMHMNRTFLFAIIYTAATKAAFIGKQHNGWFALFGILNEYITATDTW